MTEPVDNIVWMDASTLRANHWNPNRVFKAETRLLATSILKTGWIQPLLINTTLLIIDGFHRWRLSQDSKQIVARWHGRVPCAVLDIPDDEAMALTVRINRARGTAMATSMHELVMVLVEQYGWTPERIMAEVGCDRTELNALMQPDVFTDLKVKDWQYSRAWYPADGPLGGRKGSAWAEEQKTRK